MAIWKQSDQSLFHGSGIISEAEEGSRKKERDDTMETVTFSEGLLTRPPTDSSLSALSHRLEKRDIEQYEESFAILIKPGE